MPELPADVTSLSVLAGNYWTSNPVGGERFEMLLPPPNDIDVNDSGARLSF